MSKFITLADDVATPSRTSIDTTPTGYRCETDSPGTTNALVVNDPRMMAPLSDESGSQDRTMSLMTSTARSPLAIGLGLVGGGYTGWKLYPRARKRYGKGMKAYAVAGAGGIVAGVIAHGLSSFVLYKWGGR